MDGPAADNMPAVGARVIVDGEHVRLPPHIPSSSCPRAATRPPVRHLRAVRLTHSDLTHNTVRHQVGCVAYKGLIKGRKGQWLGMEMEETVGDCDGMLKSNRYFQCHDGQGLFIKWESGRVEAKPDRATFPDEMMEHMQLLFDSHDTSKTGGIDVNELGAAMGALGQAISRKDVQKLFAEVQNNAERSSNSTRRGVIVFAEFVELMEQQWSGINLGKVIGIIAAEEAEEEARLLAKANELPEVEMIVDVLGVEVDLKYFGAGTNGFLLVIYAFLSMGALWQLYLDVPEDLFNRLMVVTLMASASLFGIGGAAISTRNWPTVKLYAVLLFGAGGMQLTLFVLQTSGLFQLSTGVVATIMDRECGTCIGPDKDACSVSTHTIPTTT